MANWNGASRQFKRDNEVCRFIFTKELREADPALIYWRDWQAGGKHVYRQHYTRTSKGIHLFDREPDTGQQQNGYTIAFNTVQLTYGVRYQFTCPKCSCAARILYLETGMFACRACHHITYKSTHSSDLERLVGIVERMRVSTFGKALLAIYKHTVFESSDGLPKPIYEHNRTFEHRLKKLTDYEQKLRAELTRRGFNC